jgi:hypothetical protein
LEQRVLPLTAVCAAFLAACGTAAPPAASSSSQNAPSIASRPVEPGSPEVALERDGKKVSNSSEQAKEIALPRTGAPGSIAEPLPRGTLVLHIGDSFAGALGVPLGQRLRAAGLRSVLKFQTSSYVPTWASGKEVPEYVSHYNPDLVLITLGANEFDLTAPETRAAAVRRLVQHLGGRPCVWISPPRWKQDSGILAVIEQNSAPCRFLDSDSIVHDLARKPDKIHPSDLAREEWADAVLDWLTHERNAQGARPWDLKQQ